MIYTIGETVLDIIIKNMQPQAIKAGGSALNSSISLARLGNAVSFISELGNDKPGSFILDFLSENGVNTSYIYKHTEAKTPLALAFLNEQNDASYEFYKQLPDTVRFPSIPFTNTDILLFSSSYAISERNRGTLLSMLHAAKKKQTMCMYDPNMRKPLRTSSPEYTFFIENLSFADIVRASNEDCMNIFGTTNGIEVYKTISKFGVSVLILTQNKLDVEIYTPSYISSYAVPEIIPISTIGAGDTCNAGILHCLQKHATQNYHPKDLPRAFWDTTIPFAIACSEKVCCSYENYVSSSDIQVLLGLI